MCITVFIFYLLASCSATSKKRRFPDDFLFGASTSAYQIEGAWDVGGKSESIWDHVVHTDPAAIVDRSNGDVADNSYYEYKRDVEMMRELGLNIFRISLSWPRILPNGFTNEISETGVAFYNNYINEMLKYNITPMVAIYQWDMPQKLQDLGGLINPLFADWFENYSRVAFSLFGDRVKYWATFNEPFQICHYGYGIGRYAPRLSISDVGTYYCSKNLLLAHARAYRVYDNEFRKSQGGKVGIIINFSSFVPLTNSKADIFATEIKKQGDWGLYTDPIFSENGGFPKELSEIIARKSAKQGYKKSRLPKFTDAERALVRGSCDYLGMNSYTGYKVSATKYKASYPVPSLDSDLDVGIYSPPSWPKSTTPGLTLAPNSLYKVVSEISKKYNNPVIYITENGWPTAPGASLYDNSRIRYYRAAWENLLDALNDGINLKGYLIWSLMDNFEWTQGYTQRFGVYDVNFNCSERIRTPRKSAFVYKHLIRTRVVDHKYEPKAMTMTIDGGH